MSIKCWPLPERPREKLLRQGAEALSDAELLALVLRTGCSSSQQSALDQARELLRVFENLNRLAEAVSSELRQIPGIGPAKAAELLAVFELSRRLSSFSLEPGTRLQSAADVYHHLHARMRPLKREQFHLLLLDCKHRIIRELMISEGSLTASIVHPREVFKPIIRESAAAVIMVHNHPSGDPEPSREDVSLTQRMHQAGELMGIRVLDHVIIGHDRFTSLSELGLLSPPLSLDLPC